MVKFSRIKSVKDMKNVFFFVLASDFLHSTLHEGASSYLKYTLDIDAYYAEIPKLFELITLHFVYYVLRI